MGIGVLDLDIFGTRIRVLCEDAAAVAVLHTALAEHLISEATPHGFSVKVPQRTNGLHVLMDRSGLILGRTQTIEECVALLGSHLAALVPPPPGTTRVRMRALVREDLTAVLACFPVFAAPPLVERRLDRAHYRIIDRLAVDLSPEGGLRMTATPWPALAELHHSVPGHAPAPDVDASVTGILVPSVGPEPPSTAGLVSFIAGSVSPGISHAERISFAEQLASFPVVTVESGNRSAAYLALP